MDFCRNINQTISGLGGCHRVSQVSAKRARQYPAPFDPAWLPFVLLLVPKDRPMRKLAATLFAAAAVGALATPALADEAGVEFFEKKIRPVLVQHCYECHSAAAT